MTKNLLIVSVLKKHHFAQIVKELLWKIHILGKTVYTVYAFYANDYICFYTTYAPECKIHVKSLLEILIHINLTYSFFL